MPDRPRPSDFKNRTLSAAQVDLRPFSISDVTGQYQGWLMDPETVQLLDVAFADRSMTALRAFAGTVSRDPNRLFFMIAVRNTGAAIGTANLQIDPIHGVANYGYMIGEREWWGTSVAMETQVALFDFAFDELDTNRFYGGARLDNVMSQFNFKRFGFSKEGVFRQHVHVALDRDEFTDSVYYGLLQSEWDAIREKFDRYRYKEAA